MRLLEPKATIVFVSFFFLKILPILKEYDRHQCIVSVPVFSLLISMACMRSMSGFLHFSICTEFCPVAFVRVWSEADYYPKILSENDMIEQTFRFEFHLRLLLPHAIYLRSGCSIFLMLHRAQPGIEAAIHGSVLAFSLHSIVSFWGYVFYAV